MAANHGSANCFLPKSSTRKEFPHSESVSLPFSFFSSLFPDRKKNHKNGSRRSGHVKRAKTPFFSFVLAVSVEGKGDSCISQIIDVKNCVLLLPLKTSLCRGFPPPELFCDKGLVSPVKAGCSAVDQSLMALNS